jgi:flavorubredoxin
MHGSTKKMVECLVDALVRLDVKVHRFDMQSTDLGKLAIALVDAATIVLATPTVLVGPHPAIVEAAFLGNALRPKARFAAILNSYGWASKAVEQLSGMLTSLKPEVLGVVSSKGYPRKEHCDEIEKLAETIAAKHKEIGAV